MIISITYITVHVYHHRGQKQTQQAIAELLPPFSCRLRYASLTSRANVPKSRQAALMHSRAEVAMATNRQFNQGT